MTSDGVTTADARYLCGNYLEASSWILYKTEIGRHLQPPYTFPGLLTTLEIRLLRSPSPGGGRGGNKLTDLPQIPLLDFRDHFEARGKERRKGKKRKGGTDGRKTPASPPPRHKFLVTPLTRILV